MLRSWAPRRVPRGPRTTPIIIASRLPQAPRVSHHRIFTIARKRPGITHHVCSNPYLQPRFLGTVTIPSILVPPLIFLGLLLGLWTWKCFWIILLQDKLLYLTWLPPFTRSEKIADYEAQCRPVQWEERQVRSLDGTKLAVCEGRIPALHKDQESRLDSRGTESHGMRGANRKKSVVICYFQGNGGSTPMRLPLLSQVLRTISEMSKSASCAARTYETVEYIMVALSYRGYWTSSGRATQSGIEMDAQAFLNWVSETYTTPENDTQVILWGHSLGAAVASAATAAYLPRRVASDKTSRRPLAPVAGLVLEAPTSSIKDMLISLYPQKWLPYRYLWPFSWNTWDITASMKQMAGWRDGSDLEGLRLMAHSLPPILLMSAEKDEVIPSYVPMQLERCAQSLGLDFESKNVAGAMHIEAPIKPEGRKALADFVLKSSSAIGEQDAVNEQRRQTP